MAFFAPTALAGALLLALVLALAVDLGLAAGVDAFATLVLFLVVALFATCRPFEATVGFAVDLGLAAAVDALAVTALVLGLVVALPATCRPFEATLRVAPLVFERLLRGFFSGRDATGHGQGCQHQETQQKAEDPAHLRHTLLHNINKPLLTDYCIQEHLT